MNKILETLNQYFQDKRGRMVYYESSKQIAYFVPENLRFIVSLLHQRFTVAIIVGLLAYFLNQHIVICVVLSFGVLFALDYILKQRVLPHFSFSVNYDLKEQTKKTVTKEMIKKSYIQIVLRFVLAIIFIVITLLAQEQQSRIQTVALVLIGVYFLISSIRNYLQLNQQKRI